MKFIQNRMEEASEQGYLTYAEVNDHLPDDISDPEQIEDIIGMCMLWVLQFMKKHLTVKQ